MAEGKFENPLGNLVAGAAAEGRGSVGPRISADHGRVDSSLAVPSAIGVDSGPETRRTRHFASVKQGGFGAGGSSGPTPPAVVELSADYSKPLSIVSQIAFNLKIEEAAKGPFSADKFDIALPSGGTKTIDHSATRKEFWQLMSKMRIFHLGAAEAVRGGFKDLVDPFLQNPHLEAKDVVEILNYPEVREKVVKYGQLIKQGIFTATDSNGTPIENLNSLNNLGNLPLEDLVALQLLSSWNLHPDNFNNALQYNEWAKSHSMAAKIFTPMQRDESLAAFLKLGAKNATGQFVLTPDGRKYTLQERAVKLGAVLKLDGTSNFEEGYRGAEVWWVGDYLQFCGIKLEDLERNWNDPDLQRRIKSTAEYFDKLKKASDTVSAMTKLETAEKLDGEKIRKELNPVFGQIPDGRRAEVKDEKGVVKIVDLAQARRDQIGERTKTEVQKNTAKDLRDEIEGTREYSDLEAQAALKKIDELKIQGKISEQSVRDLKKEVVTRKTKGSFLSKIGKPEFILGARGLNFGLLIIPDIAGLIPFIDFEKSGWYKGVKRWTGISVPVAAEMVFIWSKTNDIFLAFGVNWGTLLLYLGTNMAINLADDLIFHQGWTLKAQEKIK